MVPLSISASVIAVLQLTGEVIKYLHDVKDAPKECRQCTIEASNLYNLLTNLRYRLEDATGDDPWYTALKALNVEDGPFDQYRQALEQLLSRVTIQDGLQKIRKRLLWKFSKAEVASILARIERLKSLVSIALEMDHLYVQQS
jgi:hypothetical protein